MSAVLSTEQAERLQAVADLAGRCGATKFEIGYHEDESGWYAEAFFRGARLADEAPGPIEAGERLARRLLRGATCLRCGEPILLDDVHPPVLRGCRWQRKGPRWEPGCGGPRDEVEPFVDRDYIVDQWAPDARPDLPETRGD